jgi:predicted ATPase
MVAGDVMNTAARVQTAAPAGGILVGEATHRLTARAIEYRESDPVVAKGKSAPIATWLAVAPRARFGVDVFQTGRAPLVGREREVELLAATLARARDEQEPQLVTVVGVPGIGKSRLVSELARIVDADPELIIWRQGRSLPYGESAGFWAISEIVKAQAGILESDPAAVAEEKLARTVADLVDETDADWLERHLRPLVGLAGTGAPTPEQRAEAFSAWRRFFEALAERASTVVVFEDLHWADDALLDFVDELPDRVSGVPLLVVGTARPELLERRPGWGGGKRNALTVSLAPLSDDDTARLLAALLERSVLPADEQAVLLQRAGGNPLYAEEYVRMLADGGIEIGVPETLQGVVAARIDALDEKDKLLLRQAAVLGKVFWTDALAALVKLDVHAVEERLYVLERKEFVRREQRSAVAGARQYTFVHALVRDGAYNQMPRAVRADAHERVADWIEQLPDDRAADRSEMVAHHLVQALEYGHSSGRDVSSLVPRAARALRAAGEHAFALGSLHRALPLLEHANEIDPASAEEPFGLLLLGRVLLYVHGEGKRELTRAAAALADLDATAAAEAEMALGELVWQSGEQEGAFMHFERAASLVEEAPASLRLGWVVSQHARFLALAGRYAEALRQAERALALAKELDDTELLGDALNTRGVARAGLGNAGWDDDLERSLELALANNSWRAGRAYINLGSVLSSEWADLRRSDELFREGLLYVERLGHAQFSQRWFGGNLCESAYELGRWDEALELAEQQLGHPERHYVQQMCRAVRARIRLARGEVEEAVEDSLESLVEARSIRDPQALVPALGGHAFVEAAAGRTLEARRALDELDEALRESEEPISGPWPLDVAFADLDLDRTGRDRPVEALGHDTPWRAAALLVQGGDLVGAADLLQELGAASREAHARLRAASRIAAEGRHGELSAQVQRALAFYRQVGAAAAIREAEEFLQLAS